MDAGAVPWRREDIFGSYIIDIDMTGIHTHIYICMYVYINIYITYIYVYIYICIYIFLCTYDWTYLWEYHGNILMRKSNNIIDMQWDKSIYKQIDT